MPVTSVHEPSSVIFSSMPQPDQAHRHGGVASLTCPDCGKHSLKRIHRRNVDRFTSMFMGSRRFACRDMRCHWLGNLTRNAPRHGSTAIARVHPLLWSAALLTLIVGAEFWRG